MSDDLPRFHEGDVIEVFGERYEIETVDPVKDGVRAYYLDGDTDATVRMEPMQHNGCFALVSVRDPTVDDVEVIEGGD